MSNSISKYFSKEQSEEGIQAFIPDPFTREPSKDWLRIHGDDSERYEDAMHDYRRKLSKLKEDDKEERKNADLEFHADLVSDWGDFDEKFDRKVLIESMRNGPLLKDFIFSVSRDRSLFLKKT